MPEFARMTLNDSGLIPARVVDVNTVAMRMGADAVAVVIVVVMPVNVFRVGMMRVRAQARSTEMMVNVRSIASVMMVKRCAHDRGLTYCASSNVESRTARHKQKRGGRGRSRARLA